MRSTIWRWSEVLATGYPALAELRAEGMVGAVGAGMNQAAMLADLVRETDVDVVMLAGRYTLLEQEALDNLLPLCEERRVGIVAAGVFNSGLLARARSSAKTRRCQSRRRRPSQPPRHHPQPARGTEVQVRRRCRGCGTPRALRWPRRRRRAWRARMPRPS